MADKTPTQRPKRVARALCPFCNVRREVMPSGKFELHTYLDRWTRRRCRGSGELAHAAKK